VTAYRVDLVDRDAQRPVYSGFFRALTARGADRKADRILRRHATSPRQCGHLYARGRRSGEYEFVQLLVRAGRSR
jgi:hypothetical protein